MKLPARSAAAAAAALCVAAAAAPAASAASAPACPQVPVSQAFAAWGDKSFYLPAPDGGFEGRAAGWSLAGASVVADDGPLTSGSRALELGQGASATSPALCAAKGFPYARLFARGGGTVRVDVLRGASVHLAGNVGTKASWAPSSRLSLAQGQVNRAGTTVRLRFTAVRGTARIDDVLVDPRLSR